MRQRHQALSFARFGTFILLLAFMLVDINGCGSNTVTLTYWYTESTAETPVILQLIQQFQQLNPTIKINAEYKSFQQLQTAFVTSGLNTSDQADKPDVLRSDVDWVTQFASQGYLLDIGSYISQSDNDLSDYELGPLGYDPLDFDKYNKKFYGLPQVTDFLALLYNKAEFAQAGITSFPTTMDDFKDDAKKIVQWKSTKNATAATAAAYGFETDGASYDVLPFLWAFGGGMIDDNKILVNDQKSVNGLNFLLGLQSLQLKNGDHVMPPQVNFNNGYNNMVNDFKSGETAMIFDGPWEVSNILTGSAFIGNPSNLGIAAIPIGPSGDQQRSPVGGQSYVISARTAHAKEAYNFISFMSRTDSQVAIAKVNHTLPTRQSAYQKLDISPDPVIQEFLKIQNTAVLRPIIPQGGHLFDMLDPNIRAALDGAKSPTEALDAVACAWGQLLGKTYHLEGNMTSFCQ